MGFFRFLFSVPAALVLGLIAFIPLVGSFLLFCATWAWAREAGGWGFVLGAVVTVVITIIAGNSGALFLIPAAVAVVTLLWGIGL